MTSDKATFAMPTIARVEIEGNKVDGFIVVWFADGCAATCSRCNDMSDPDNWDWYGDLYPDWGDETLFPDGNWGPVCKAYFDMAIEAGNAAEETADNEGETL